MFYHSQASITGTQKLVVEMLHADKQQHAQYVFSLFNKLLGIEKENENGKSKN